MKIWFKMFKDTRLLETRTLEDHSKATRTHKIFRALEEVCFELDLAKPIWLQSNINEFSRYAKTRFYQDSFVEEIDFDFLEMQVLEED